MSNNYLLANKNLCYNAATMKKPSWQLTATTIKCDSVDDEITIMVQPDGTAKCASYAKYGTPDKKTLAGMAKKAKIMGLMPKCDGPQCHRITDYRDRIMGEEDSA